MKKFIFNLLLLSLFSSISLAQVNEVKTFSQNIKQNRYDGFKGSPFYFKNPVKARLIQRDGSVQEDVPINFNGYTQNFEINQGEKIALLDKNKYRMIVVEKEGNENEKMLKNVDKLVFGHGFHDKFLNSFAVMIYQGQQMKFIKDITTELSIVAQGGLGKITELKKFVTREQYYILTKGELLFPIKLKGNQVIRVLGDQKELDVSRLRSTLANVEELRKFEYLIEDTGGYIVAPKDLMREDKNYFISIKQDLLFPVDLNKRSMMEIVGEVQSNDVRNYLKENKNTLGSESEIVDFLKFYEEKFLK